MLAVKSLGRGHLHSVLFIACLAFVTFPQMWTSYRSAEGLQFSWTTSKVWLASAECAKTTGKLLVLCRDNEVVPIANGFGGDDLGHALALEIYSAITQTTVRPEQISLLNTTVNYVALILLALLLLSMALPVTSLAMLTAGTITANQLHVLTPHPAQFGVACFAAILPIAILGNFRFRTPWIVIGFITLALALLFREAIGMMGVIAAIIAALLKMVRSRSVIPQSLLILAIVATSATPFLILRARDVAYRLPPPAKLESHGTWANLYMGLGGVPNPFGIEWNDYSAIDAVKAVDPSVPYLSPRFYDILRTRYFDIVRQNPMEVLVVYIKKLALTLKSHMPSLIPQIALWQLLAIIAAAGLIVLRWKPQSDNFDAVIVASAAFTGVFLIQAVLINVDMQYLFPIQLFPLLAGGAVLDMLLPSPN